MSKKLVELKPCPFCGGEAKRSVGADDFWWNFVYCDNEKCNIKPETKCYRRISDATKAWNRRAEVK